MKSFCVFMLVFVWPAILFAAPSNEPSWHGFLWRVNTELSFELSLGHFDTLQTCRKTAMIRVLASGWKDGADWECGLNCKPASFAGGSWTCETERNSYRTRQGGMT